MRRFPARQTYATVRKISSTRPTARKRLSPCRGLAHSMNGPSNTRAAKSKSNPRLRKVQSDFSRSYSMAIEESRVACRSATVTRVGYCDRADIAVGGLYRDEWGRAPSDGRHDRRLESPPVAAIHRISARGTRAVSRWRDPTLRIAASCLRHCQVWTRKVRVIDGTGRRVYFTRPRRVTLCCSMARLPEPRRWHAKTGWATGQR